MYDQREKAQRDYLAALEGAQQKGIELGIEQGIEQGELMGKIELLYQLLGDEALSKGELRKLSTDELSSMLTELQERLRSRGL